MTLKHIINCKKGTFKNVKYKSIHLLKHNLNLFSCIYSNICSAQNTHETVTV